MKKVYFQSLRFIKLKVVERIVENMNSGMEFPGKNSVLFVELFKNFTCKKLFQQVNSY